MTKERKFWPSTRYGPNGQSRVFQNEEEVPSGWVDHPSKVSGAEDLSVEREAARQEAAAAKGARVAAEEKIRLSQIEERRRTGSNTAADNVIRRDPGVVALAEKQQASSRTEAQTGTDDNDLGTIAEIKSGLESGKLTLDQVEEAEKQRENPRSTIFALIEKKRKEEQEPETITREEAIAELRKHSVEIADDASDAEIEAALNKLEES